MSRNLKESAVQPAQRTPTTGWRDPRLWVGVALVAGSVVAGSQVLAAADDTTAVWATRGHLAQGETIQASDLVPVRVRFDDPDDARHYIAVDEEFPDDVTAARPLGPGELVPVAALGGVGDVEVVSMALSLPPEEVPHGLSEGSRVDVWVVGEGEGRDVHAEVVLDDVAVLAVPEAGGSFGATGAQQVVVAVPDDESDAMASILAASHREAVRIVGRTAR